MLADVATGLVGVLGVLVGVAANEVLRRNNRIESYSARVFDKRLAIYEELLTKMVEGREVADDVMCNAEYSRDERHALISVTILDIAKFIDDNALYLDQDLGAHCVATFMGAEDVYDVESEVERDEMRRGIRAMDISAQRMIREDSGVAEINKLFKKLNKPSLSSPVIDRIRELKKDSANLSKA